MPSEDDYQCWNSLHYTSLAPLAAMGYKLDEFRLPVPEQQNDGLCNRPALRVSIDNPSQDN